MDAPRQPSDLLLRRSGDGLKQQEENRKTERRKEEPKNFCVSTLALYAQKAGG